MLLKPFIILLSFLYAEMSIAAQQIPDAGILLQQTVPTLPAEPSANDTGIKLPTRSGVSDTTPFIVSKIHFKGNALVSTQDLKWHY